MQGDLADCAPMEHDCAEGYSLIGRAVVEKRWGQLESVYCDRQMELVRITTCRGGYSSLHLHRAKDNAFWVIRGCLQVSVYSKPGIKDFYLTPKDELLTVPAGVMHRFLAHESETIAYELYRALPGHRLDPDDIVRMDEGGVMALTES
jgi:mannose-6-phosphate isomerase-like protein (cupin superfamily)